MKIEFPLISLFGYRVNAQTYEFLGRTGKIEISGYSSRRLESILRLMNGRNSVKQIAERVRSSISREELDGVMETLHSSGVIVDSRYLFEQFHIDSSNPSEFVQRLSNQQIQQMVTMEAFGDRGGSTVHLSPPKGRLSSLLDQRRSQRDFSGEKLPMNQLSGLLSAMYGENICRPVPSAGGLYPMTIFVQLLAGVSGLEAGLYQYLPRTNSLTLHRETKVHQLYSIFDSVSLCEHAAILIMVVANLSHVAQKYANRGYRYALIESGHICQNAYLYSTEQGLGVVEFGGYKDERLAGLLGLNYPEEVVLSSLFVGKKSTSQKVVTELGMFDCNRLVDEMVVRNKLVSSVDIVDLEFRSYVPSFVAARCRYPVAAKTRNDYSFATGLTSFEAQFKALVEAYERIVCSRPRCDVLSAAKDLNVDWIDPRKYFPYSSRQAQDGLVPLSLNVRKKLEWVNATRIRDGSNLLVPVDMVFYPIDEKDVGRRLTYRADSSGVAAHTDIKKAKINALFELIERDALMLHWYCRTQPTKLPKEVAPESVQESVDYWTRVGVSVELVDITIDSVPVVLCLIHSPKMKPYFVSGAAAGLDYNSAINKAFQEAELMWLSWRKCKIPRINRRKVVSPKDHGVLYMNTGYSRYLKKFLTGKEALPREKINLSPEKLFDPVLVVIDNGDNPYGLKVVRVLSESLLPINFGFGTESSRHRRIRSLGLTWERTFPSQPHFFA